MSLFDTSGTNGASSWSLAEGKEGEHAQVEGYQRPTNICSSSLPPFTSYGAASTPLVIYSLVVVPIPMSELKAKK